MCQQSQNLNDYDDLDCPYCEHPCKPVKIKKNGTVLYTIHLCVNGMNQFSIDVNGDLVE